MTPDRIEQFEDSVASSLVRIVLFVAVTAIAASVFALIPMMYLRWIVHLERIREPVPDDIEVRIAALYILVGIVSIVFGGIAALFGPALWNRFGRTRYVSMDEIKLASAKADNQDWK